MEEDVKKEEPAYSLQHSSEALLSIQRLDFKTNFLEAVEELRMRRDAEIHYEEQIRNFVVEKQELEWQKEVLQHQNEALNKQHTEAMTAFKKQFQARIFALEEEKGKYLLAAQSKEKEIEGVKETLKTLQMSKYTLQKKLDEMEQKLQLHMLAKEDHQKSLNEVEKCHAVITCQFGRIKEAHEKLEQNVVEAIQLNKKLTAVKKRQESEIENLKEELKKITADLIKSNVACQHREGEENLNLTRKEQEIQELQQKISMETELNRKIIEENAHLKEEKQEIIASLQHMQQLLCRKTETNVKMEMVLNELKERYQTLERDNELQREKAKENEEKFLNLQNEYEKAQATWKNKADDIPDENQIPTSQKENKCAQITIDDVNSLEQEETGVENTVTCSLGSDEMLTDQNNVDINTEEVNSIGAKDLSCLESYMNEDEMAHPCKENQREISVGKALCTVDFITSGLTCGSCVAECKETAAKGTVAKKIFDKLHAGVEVKSPDIYSLAQLPVEDSKILPASVEAVVLSNTGADHQKKINKHAEGGGTNEFVSEINEDINNTHQEGAFCTSEAFSQESKLQDNATSEKINSILSQMKESNCIAFHNNDSECSDICKTEQTPSDQNTTCITTSKIPLCKQISTYLEERHSDNVCKHNRCCETGSTCNTLENTPHTHASFSSHVDKNIHTGNGDDMNNLALVGSPNANAESPSKGMNVHEMNEMQIKQSDKDHSSLRKVSTNTAEGTNKVLPLNTESVYKQTAVDLKTNKIASEQHIMVCDKENTLLKEREESLSDMTTGEITAEGSTEGSCSFPVKISDSLVKRNGKLPFDLPTMDNKTEKTSSCLDLPKVHQAESQTTCSSNSKMPFLLKEKLFLLEIKDTNTRKLDQNMNMNETLASTHSNRVADTLNTGSINLGPKRNPSEEWNAIAKTFYDPSFPTEHVKTVCLSEPQQKSIEVPSEVNAATLSESSQSSKERNWNSQNVFIKTQIKSIEKFLYLERLCQPRKRKYEEDLERAMIKDKVEK